MREETPPELQRDAPTPVPCEAPSPPFDVLQRPGYSRNSRYAAGAAPPDIQRQQGGVWRDVVQVEAGGDDEERGRGHLVKI